MAVRTSGGKLGEILVRNGAVKPDALAEAEVTAKGEGIRLEKFLVARQVVPAAEMVLALAEYLEMRPIVLTRYKMETHLAESAPKDLMKKHQMVPVSRLGRNLTVAMADPFDIFALDELHTNTGLDITPLVASEKDIADALARCYMEDTKGIDMEDIMRADGEVDLEAQEDEESVSMESMMDAADEAPVIRLVNMIIIEGMRLKSNDIHIEPQENYVRLRYRVDGDLVERPHLQKGMQNAIISRIKIMADMDIGEQRIPQDGKYRFNALGKKIDVRVSVLPTIFGGKVVMRILDKGALFPGLGSLKLDQKSADALNYAIAQPNGIILVTGPTGSGKTTTLYSCLQELNKPDVNIVTCEDPVEYQLHGINQVRIHTEIGLTFASALRAILRQDPDVLLIGEIRDTETGEIAIKAAMTGHLVLSTLHSNDAAGAITRLLEMGIEPFMVGEAIKLAQAQRLYRRLCPVCKKEALLSPEIMREYGVKPEVFEGVKTFGPIGCPKCNNLGFSGRASIMEVLPVSDEIRMAILEQVAGSEIRERAIKQGMVSLMQAGLNKVRDGETSLDHVIKITGGVD